MSWCDADWAGCKDTRRSTSGYAYLLGGSVSWSSKQQSVVALSSMEAEYIALSSACQERTWLVRLLSDLQMLSYDGHVVHEDNQGALAFSRNPTSHQRSKHIDVRHHYVRDMVRSGDVHLVYCPSGQMLADMLTKPVDRIIFERCWDGLGVKSFARKAPTSPEWEC